MEHQDNPRMENQCNLRKEHQDNLRWNIRTIHGWKISAIYGRNIRTTYGWNIRTTHLWKIRTTHEWKIRTTYETSGQQICRSEIKGKLLQPIVFRIRIQDTELTYTICRISLALVPVDYYAAWFRCGIVPLASGALIAYVSAYLLLGG